MSTKVFVYGSLKQGYWNNRLLANSIMIGRATTNDGFTMINGGFPYVLTDGKFSIFGEVYEVDDGTLRSLDHLEGVPHHYTRLETEVFGEDGDVHHCLMYVASSETARYVGNREQVLPNEEGVCEWH